MKSQKSKLALHAKLKELEALPNGWRYGEGSPVSKLAADAIRQVIESLDLQAFDVADVVPGSSGDAQIVFRKGSSDFELSASSSGSLTLECVEEYGAGESSGEFFPTDASTASILLNALLYNAKCTGFDSFTLGTIQFPSEDLPAPRFRTVRGRMAASPSYWKIAPARSLAARAVTSGPATRSPQESHRYFGASISQSFPVEQVLSTNPRMVTYATTI